MRRAPAPSRASVLHAVTEEILARQDGQLPTDVEHVEEFFPDTDALVDALLLRWHALLTARLERALGSGSDQRRESVVEAWRHAAASYRGVRRLLDELAEHPPSTAVADAVHSTARHDWAAMAVAAGLASGFDEPAIRLGQQLEREARRRDRLALARPGEQGQQHHHQRLTRKRLVRRVKMMCAR